MAEILFAYKGRYWVEAANTLELLSAQARAAGWGTRLAFDRDLFGVSDNVFSWPRLNRLIDPLPRLAASAAAAAPDYVVFLSDAAGDAWAAAFMAGLRRLGSSAQGVLAVPSGSGAGSGFDHVLSGEAEAVFPLFLAAAAAGRPPGALESRSLADLDALPPADRSIFEKSVDFSLSCMVYASRGCRGGCAYCAETILMRESGPGYFRRRSVEGLMSELSALKARYATRELIFKDPVFTDDPAWLRSFAAAYRERIGVPYKCFARADQFDADRARLLKESGCYCVEFGLQTFNDDLRREAGRPETGAQLEAAFSACAGAGLAFDADYLFGLPGESLDGHKAALLRFSRLQGLNRVKCHNLVYHRGGAMTEKAVAAGRMAPEAAGSGDFFSGDRSAAGMRFYNGCFRKLFKLGGLLGGTFSRALLFTGLWRLFYFLPGPLVAALEMAAGLARGDRRFSIYLRLYPQKISDHFRG